jgi:hypothetical protein
MNSLMLAAAHTTNLQTTELTLWLSVLRGQAVAYATLLSLSLIAGCGPQNPTTYPVQGRVEFEDGSVAEIGNVEFRSMTGNERMTARGKIENDGSFILSTFETGDGALPGEHQVIVQQMVIAEGMAHHQHGRRIPAKYSDYGRSGLNAHVKEQRVNPIVIKLDSKAK